MSRRRPPRSELEALLEAARAAAWRRPPAAARHRARRRPAGDPAPPAPEAAGSGAILPPDVRGLAPPGSETVQSHSLPDLEVTLRLGPAQNGLWRLEGRVWREDGRGGPLRVYLTQAEHVLDEARVEDGGAFRFQQALRGEWSLEIHPEEGEPAVLGGRTP